MNNGGLARYQDKAIVMLIACIKLMYFVWTGFITKLFDKIFIYQY